MINNLKALGVEPKFQTLVTRNYSIFKTHPVNRDIEDKKVNRLVRIMEEDGWLQGSYIIVDKHFVIINGQHRFEAARILGIELEFIQLPIKATSALIRKNNQNQTNWKIEDSIGGFAKEGHKEYVELRKLGEEYPDFKQTDTIMLGYCNTGSFKKDVIENGDFKMTDPEKSREWAERLLYFKKYLPDSYNTRYFTRAVVKFFTHPDFDWDHLVKRIEECPGKLINWKLVDRNVEMLLSIYNRHLRKDKRLSID
jgi:hypothetical protein